MDVHTCRIVMGTDLVQTSRVEIKKAKKKRQCASKLWHILTGFWCEYLTDYQYTQYPMVQHFSGSPRQNPSTKVHTMKSYLWNYKVAVQKGVGNLYLIFVPITYHTCTNHQLPLKYCTYVMKTWRIHFIYVHISLK